MTRTELLARVRELRQAHGVSQRDFAMRVGCGQNMIARYELGHVDPALSTFVSIVEALGYTLELVEINE